MMYMKMKVGEIEMPRGKDEKELRDVKCVECQEEAEFVFGGDSCCKKHFEDALERLKKEEE